ncbi:unnamed protein product [Pylaiella littoralis]
MNRTQSASQSRRWARQGASGAGRSRARSAAPVVVLVACMVAVLYGSQTYFSNTLRSHHSHDTPPSAGSPVQDGHQSSPSGRNTAETRGGGAVSAIETLGTHVSFKEPLLEEEQLAEPPLPSQTAAGAAVVAFTARGEDVEMAASRGDGGGVQYRWNGDGASKMEDERGVRAPTVGGANVMALDEEGGGGEGRWGGDEGVAANIDRDGGGISGGYLATAPAPARKKLATADGAAVFPAADDSVRDAEGGGVGDAKQGGGGSDRVIEEGEGGRAVASKVLGGLPASRSNGSTSEAATPVVPSGGREAEPDGIDFEVPRVEGGVVGVELTGLSTSRSQGGPFVAVLSRATVPARAAAAAAGGTGEGDEECGVNCSKHSEVGQEQRQLSEESSAPNVLLQPGKEADIQRQQELQEQEKVSEKNASEGLRKRSEREGAPQMPPTVQAQAPEDLLQQPGDTNANLAEEADTEESLAQRQEHVEQVAEGIAENGSDAEKDTKAMVKGTDAEVIEKEEPAVVVVAGAQGKGAEGGAVNNGAVRGSMQCASTKLGEGVDSIVNIATWKDVPGDAAYRSPFAEASAGRYVTLQKDLGGFNNIRLSLECGVALAAATGRTFVIPPPLIISNMKGAVEKKVDLRELFTFDKLRGSGRVNIITTEEFLVIEAVSGGLGIQPGEKVTQLDAQAVDEYMIRVAGQYEGGLPEISLGQSAFVMPRRIGGRVNLEDEEYAFAKTWLIERELLEYREKWAEAKVLHWRAKEARLLAPFYTFVLHGDEVSDRYHKRLMRDLLHYPEEVFCKASQIISLLRKEDPSGDFSTFHVRRNDFKSAYKMVFMEISEVIANSADHLYDNEVVYVATDEKDKSLFEPFAKHVRVKFLSDYYERAGVSELDPNLLGMLDQVIASHGRTFTGCWLSTFTAYILRLRGYLQKPRTSNWSYFNFRKDYHQEYRMPERPLWMTEWPLGWEGIDETGVPDAMAP